MKGVTGWSYSPYRPPEFNVGDIYVCRIAPEKNGFHLEWLPLEGVTSYTVNYRLRGSDLPFTEQTVQGTAALVQGLLEGRDYECRVTAAEKQSRLRLVRTGAVPGDAIVNYLHPEDLAYAYSGRYLCSPSLLRHPDGYLLASMDLYKTNAPQNLTLIFRSDDDGKSWYYLTELYPCFWGKMFLHKGQLYMLAVSTEYGDLLIGRSDDGGKTWTNPTVLLRGGCHAKEVGWHRAPMPVLIKDGRIMTDVQYGAWSEKVFCDAVLSAPVDSDLLDPENWLCTELFDARGHISPLPEKIWGGIEGNVIETPDGRVVDLLRFADKTALVLNYDPKEPEAEPTLDKVIDFPATASKFNVVFDGATKKYYAIVSYALDEPKTRRNLLSLIRSADLEKWELCRHLIDRREDDPKAVGFQYVDFLIEGEDVLFLCRTAVNGADSFHNSNFTTFHRIKNFREIKE